MLKTSLTNNGDVARLAEIELKFPPFGKRKPFVLIAESHDDTRLMLETALRLKGYRAIGVSDGAQISFQVKVLRPDLLLLDADALLHNDVREQIQILTKNLSIPIIVTSAHPQASMRELAFTTGAKEYLVKPISLEHLETVIRDFVS